MYEISKGLRDGVRNAGYDVIAWALTKLIAAEQYSTAGMIIVALCMLRRNTEIENNGVIAILTNRKLKSAVNREQMHAIEDWMKVFWGNYDKILATLLSCEWYNKYYGDTWFVQPAFNSLQPRLVWHTDGVCCYYAARKSEHDQTPNEAHRWDSANRANVTGTRIIYRHDGPDGVAILSRQRFFSDEGKMPVGNGWFETRLPSDTLLYGFGMEHNGRRLCDVLKPGLWHNWFLTLDSEPDLVSAEDRLKEERRQVHLEMMADERA